MAITNRAKVLYLKACANMLSPSSLLNLEL